MNNEAIEIDDLEWNTTTNQWEKRFVAPSSDKGAGKFSMVIPKKATTWKPLPPKDPNPPPQLGTTGASSLLEMNYWGSWGNGTSSVGTATTEAQPNYYGSDAYNAQWGNQNWNSYNANLAATMGNNSYYNIFNSPSNSWNQYCNQYNTLNNTNSNIMNVENNSASTATSSTNDYNTNVSNNTTNLSAFDQSLFKKKKNDQEKEIVGNKKARKRMNYQNQANLESQNAGINEFVTSPTKPAPYSNVTYSEFAYLATNTNNKAKNNNLNNKNNINNKNNNINYKNNNINNKNNNKNANNKGQSEAVQYPASLHKYIEDSFLKYKTNSHKNDKVELKLKQIVSNAEKEGTLWDTDWARKKLPDVSFSSSDDMDVEAKEPPLYKSFYAIGENSNANGNGNSKKNKKKEKTKEKQKDEKKLKQQFSIVSDQSKIQGRAKRFEDNGYNPYSNYQMSARPTYSSNKQSKNYMDDEPINYTVVGTCEVLEKKYLRLTSEPEPSCVRPERVLIKSMNLIKQRWNETKDWEWTYDQLKSVRQDLTVQNIRNEFTVLVYEMHARLCLENKDIAEYNQCQSQLMQLYALDINGCVTEFTAYRILMSLYHSKTATQNKLLTEIKPSVKREPAIKHALETFKSVEERNYVKFFRLCKETPNIGTYIIGFVIDKIRVDALKAITTAFRPSVTVDYVTSILGFENKSVCLTFLKTRSFVFLPSTEIDCKSSYSEILKWEKQEEEKLLKKKTF